MAVREILRLGNPDLHRVCRAVSEDEIPFARSVAGDLHDTLLHFRERHGMAQRLLVTKCELPSGQGWIGIALAGWRALT